MARTPTDPYIFLFKKIVHNPVVWTKPYSKAQAWIWMLLQARAVDNEILKCGELLYTQRQLGRLWGWERDAVRHFLNKLKAEGMIDYVVDEKRPRSARLSPKICPLKILNFLEYQGKPARLSPKICPDNNPLKNKDKLRTISTSSKDEIPTHEKSDNTKVYDFYIEKRRTAIQVFDWKPTETQAKAMRVTINRLLKNYPVTDLLAWLENYFNDPGMISRSFPWGIWAADPVGWRNSKQQSSRESPVKPPQHNKWDPSQERPIEPRKPENEA